MFFFFQFKVAKTSLVIYYRKGLAGKEGVSNETTYWRTVFSILIDSMTGVIE